MLLKLFLLLLIGFVPVFVSASEVAITIDDFNLKDGPLMTLKEKDERILNILEKNQVEIALFVIAGVLDRPLTKERLAIWDRTNHIIANHTYTHAFYRRLSFQEFSQEMWKADGVLSQYNNFQRYFRFPALKEGNTREKRDQMRAFLKARGYSQGYVTIDTSDWYINNRLISRLTQNLTTDLKPYRDFYLKHIWDRAEFYDGLSQKVLGRSVKHTLLIHHNLLNALFLSDLIEMFRSKGWKIISAREAFQDPVFRLEPNIVPAGESILWGLAKEAGRFNDMLRYPGEDGEYEKEPMDKLGL